MRVLFVHPSPLMFSEIYLRLEPLGLERVAAAAEASGHDVRLLDLQVYRPADYRRLLATWRPDVVGFSLNYLANVPEVVDLAREAKNVLPDVRVVVGGHSASFVATDLLAHAGGAIDCVVRGEGEGITPRVLAAFGGGEPLRALPGVVTDDGAGPPPLLVPDLAAHRPARHLAGRRRSYFIGELDPCASVEFTRGCPWDCTFCSAWTFYGRSYRTLSADAGVEDLASITEPNVFIVDDVAFIRAEDGLAIADEIERRKIRKRYYLETRADVLLRNREVFARWTKLGLRYMFLGIEAIDEEGLKHHRKRVRLGQNEEALAVARELGLVVAINIIADPDWDERRFQIVREWALEVPEIVNMTVNTPYPGTETWITESRRFTSEDYRLFDVQHAVLPTRLPLRRFYEEFVRTQDILNRKHLGWRAVYDVFGITMRLLARGQTNFVRMLWKFGSIYNVDRLLADHARPVVYPLRRNAPSSPVVGRPSPAELYVHHPTSVAAPPA
ncbi:MAG TPA: hopanoid C-3 methylase HpnR [Candidatus Binatia bacterium]|nr:hopanoid C-3 methylase HpnR [Candidatus Binatia bacterium]